MQNLFYGHTRATNVRIRESNLKIINKFTKYLKWPISPKAKKVQFKIINGYYPAAETLKKRFGFEVEPCCFCNADCETTEHLFYSCTVTSLFWQDVFEWIGNKIENITPFDKHQILLYKDNLSKEFSELVNIIIVLGKYHIHSSKWKNKHPSIVWFKN